jgi:hypothetical protein
MTLLDVLYNLFGFLVFGFYTLLVVGIVVRVIMKRCPIGVSLAWLALILAIPVLGVSAYLILGEVRLGRRQAQPEGQFVIADPARAPLLPGTAQVLLVNDLKVKTELLVSWLAPGGYLLHVQPGPRHQWQLRVSLNPVSMEHPLSSPAPTGPKRRHCTKVETPEANKDMETRKPVFSTSSFKALAMIRGGVIMATKMASKCCKAANKASLKGGRSSTP